MRLAEIAKGEANKIDAYGFFYKMKHPGVSEKYRSIRRIVQDKTETI